MFILDTPHFLSQEHKLQPVQQWLPIQNVPLNREKGGFSLLHYLLSVWKMSLHLALILVLKSQRNLHRNSEQSLFNLQKCQKNLSGCMLCGKCCCHISDWHRMEKLRLIQTQEILTESGTIGALLGALNLPIPVSSVKCQVQTKQICMPLN